VLLVLLLFVNINRHRVCFGNGIWIIDMIHNQLSASSSHGLFKLRIVDFIVEYENYLN